MILQRTAELLEGHAALEEELFRVTGFWSTEPGGSGGSPGPAAEAQALFAAESAHHGWRQEQWQRRFVRSVGPAAATEAGEDVAGRVAALVQAIGATHADGLDAPARLAVWGHVWAPTLAARYESHRRCLSAAADAGLDRWLGICVTDLQRGSLEAVRLLSNVEPSAARDAASAARVALERALGA
jgi:hypothetical protein